MPFDVGAIDSGDTAWLLASSALVLVMTPGLAFFYGGMVRVENVLGMLMQNFFCMGIVSLLWVSCTYSIAFGGDNAFFGGLHFAGLQHMSEQVPGYSGDLGQSIPPIVFAAFQLMFAIITPALITGGPADRFRFGPFATFIILWSVLVYAPVAHWVFSPTGWLFEHGAEDFAGGTVVHANAGAAAIAIAIVVGKRRGWPDGNFRPHNVPFVLLGAGLLWFGWFGFNAGSALKANELAGFAFVNTNTAAACALLGWILTEKLRDGRSTTLGAASGAVAGLVAITPAAGYVTPVGSICIGLIAGVVCASVTGIKGKIGIDDALDVGAVHLVGGSLGALLIGFWGSSQTGGADGFFYGGGLDLLTKQALAVGAVVAYSFIVTLVIGYLIRMFVRMRMSVDEEREGMDIALHGERAYDF
ncbi:ammonium transporter [Frankia sp. CNm7]|uniref:Ammonium transporter n=1 Tax=Frankia nepalensis TaxID=1836974 RepID=A0A937RNA9_9ACTN|nr:ammonium transporter [Frankia nepalensis]MBL7501033.1 ammonium transporter [Frankia nepalensis]MBL7514258.1 ammonium transporter [Frankia nepalensis]MBL7518817.1 ammonium transporter [Frankia nepalensis]MBL7632005.1 ammonium transporter [Frankia nepalensis]